VTGPPPVHRWDHVPNPCALVHVVHGMSEHGGRYARLASALNEAGYIVWAHDHRGHGGNPMPPVGLGHFGDTDGWRAVVDDAWAVSLAMQAAYPALPLMLFAHSMGSFVGQTLMIEHGDAYRAVVLSGSNRSPGALEGAVRTIASLQRRVLGAHARGMWVHRLVMGKYNGQFAPCRTTADWLSRDSFEVDRFIADKLCGVPLTTQSWLDFLHGKRALGRRDLLARIPQALPIRLIAGTRDPVGENGDGVRRLQELYQSAGLHCVSMKLYEGARHEVVNETNRDQVTADIVAWFQEVLAVRTRSCD